MTNAWTIYRRTNFTFSQSLKRAWEIAKAADLVVGDTIEIEYGTTRNIVKYVVTKISDELFMDKYLVINAKSSIDIECCMKQDALKKQIAKAAQVNNALRLARSYRMVLGFVKMAYIKDGSSMTIKVILYMIIPSPASKRR